MTDTTTNIKERDMFEAFKEKEWSIPRAGLTICKDYSQFCYVYSFTWWEIMKEHSK